MKIFQVPNKSLVIALSGLLISKIPNTLIQSTGITIYTIAIIIWSFEEIKSGANWFRRILGIIVMSSVAYSLITQLK